MNDVPILATADDELPDMVPLDVHNRTLLAHVHPPAWQNPRPQGRYNLVVLGAGPAGLVAATGAAGLGARVALIERHWLGGDCLNTGCVPSKALLRAARAAAAVRDAGQFGIEVPVGVQAHFPAVMERLRQLRAQISAHDAASRFRDLGVDVFLGHARFTSPETVTVNGQTLQFANAVIATGARASAPAIPGLADVGYLTNETVFNLTTLPSRLAVIGAGPIGCELAQAFARFGSAVFLIEAQHGILPNEDPEAAALVQQALERDGVTLLCCGRDLRVRRGCHGTLLTVDAHEEHYALEVDTVLVGVGRAPNVEGLALEAAGVAYTKTGVTVNDRLRTTNPRIYAAGDICSRYKFTHAADAMACVVLQNALFAGRARASALTIPRCTYTDPELAHVGLSPKAAVQQGITLQTFVQPLAEVDRALLDGAAEGFVKIHVRQGTDRILGATIVASPAGEMLGEVTLAMVGGLGLKTLARTIHAYPTQAEALKKIGDAYNRTRLTPRLAALLATWLA